MTIYAVASGKGGVGKTTTAVALGACMAAAGRRTVVVDADLGMPDLGAVLGLSEDGPTLHDVLAGSADIADVPREAPGGFDVVPGGASLADYAAGDPAGLRNAIEDLEAAYDIVILDTAAGLSQDVLVPLGLADQTILVATPADAALQDAEKTRQLVERVDGTVVGLVLTRVVDLDSTAASSTSAVELLGLVPEDESVRAAEQANEPVTVYAPDGPAGSAYAEVTATLLGVAVGDVALGADPEPDAETVPFASDSTDTETVDDTDEDATTTEDAPEASMVADGDVAAEPDETSDDDLVETDEDESSDDRSSRSLLSRLTGGLFG